MRLPLLWKLVIINAIGAAIVAIVMDMAVRIQAAKYFMTLVDDYNISPEKAHEMFLVAVERYLFGALAIAGGLSIGVSYWLTKRSLQPLQFVMEGARQVAIGNYAIKVEETECSEVGDLAKTFNRMIDSLVRIEQLRKDTVTNVAHELRTPLTNIRGYLEALMETVVEPSQEVFESLHDETLRLVSLSENLLHLARTDAARESLRIIVIRVDELIIQTLQLFHLRFATKQIQVEHNLDAAGVEVRADADKLSQVLTNLLENACRYTPTGGRVAIAAVVLDSFLRVSVSNTIEERVSLDASRVFERFYREEFSHPVDQEGFGLGLSIVKDLVEKHGGAVGCDSNGEVLIVWFTWPA